MHQYDSSRLEKVTALARERFDPELQPDEERILRDSCSTEDPADVEGEMTAPGKDWQGPVIRVPFLRWLMSDPDVARYFHSQAVTFDRVRFTEDLDFSNFDMKFALVFRFCLFEKKLFLGYSKLEHLMTFDCTFSDSLLASYMRMRGSFICRRTKIDGVLDLRGSHIDGDVQIDETEFTQTETAVMMQNAVVGTSLKFTENFKSAGEINLLGVRVGGAVSLRGAKLKGLPNSLVLDGARIQGNTLLTYGFEAAGMVRMMGASIGHWLNMSGAALTSTSVALSLEACQIEGHAIFLEGFTCSGEIQCVAAKIGRNLTFRGALLTKTPITLNLDNTKIGSDCVFSGGFRSSGEISMHGGEIQGDLNFAGAELSSKERTIQFNDVPVHRNVFFTDNFRSQGTVDLGGIEVHGGIYFVGAKLTDPKSALLLTRVKIKDTLFFGDGVESAGKILIHSATIDGQVVVENSTIRSLTCQNSKLKELYWKQLREPEKTVLNLSGSHILLLRDEPESWPGSGSLQLNGLVVDEFQPMDERRVNWVGRQEPGDLSEAQPWVHIAKHLRDKGYTGAAKKAIFELRRHQARARQSHSRWRMPAYLWSLLVARLEEKPQRILLSVAACVLLGTSVFWPYRAHFSETNDAAYQASHFPAKGAVDKAGAYPRFEPVFYALEDTLPIVHLGQDDRWAPDRRITAPRLYWTLVGTRWCLILAGWAQGIVLAAALDMRFRS